MKHDEIWAVSYERICEFFERASGIQPISCGKYSGEGIQIMVSRLPERALGSLRFPQTRVIIDGSGSEDLYKIFRLHFLSAGG